VNERIFEPTLVGLTGAIDLHYSGVDASIAPLLRKASMVSALGEPTLAEAAPSWDEIEGASPESLRRVQDSTRLR
jgi:hypothetical protein